MRGRILDRNGIELAANKISYVVSFNGQKASNKEVDLQTLSEIESKIAKSSEMKVTTLYKRNYSFG